MKHFLLLLMTTSICTFLFSCHTNKNDSSSSPQPAERMRIKSYTSKGSFNEVTTFTYNNQGMLTHTQSIDSLGRVVEDFIYGYNDSQQLVFFSSIDDTNSVRFTYTDFNYVSTKNSYSDLYGTTLLETYTYHYDSSHNISYIITQRTSGKDSSVFGPYVNARPLQRINYYNNGSGYALSGKSKYTYDVRMNRTKIMTSISSDTSSFYLQQQSTFIASTLNQYQIGTPITDPWGFDDINDNSPNKDQDFSTDEKQYSSCGLDGENINTYTFNSTGFPTAAQWTYTSYNCGAQLHTQTVNSTYTYETW